jgi:hypothetical protein
MKKRVRQTGDKDLQALDELPAEYVIHSRSIVSRKTSEAMLRRADLAEPTPELRELMRDGDWGAAPE